MASPVDTSVKYFHFEMEGAPVLAGQAGRMLGVLDACLVTGFGLKAATSLVVAGGVATLTFAGSHGATVESVVLVEGVTGALAALNGEQRVTARGSSQVKFATAAPDGTAAGTVTFKMAPAGWLSPFTDTNIAVYQSAAAESTKMYMRIDDTGTTAFRLRGYEVMTGASTGSGLFPVDAQISGGGWCNKSSEANATPVKWTLVADARGGYLSVSGYSATFAGTETGRTVFFGDFRPFRTGGDPYAFVLGCGTSGDYSTTPGTCDQDAAASQFAPRAYHGLGTSFAHASTPESGSTNVSGQDATFGKFPSEVDGGLMLSRRFVGAGNQAPRGVFPGLYTVPQSEVGKVYAPRSLQSGAGPLAGRKLIAVGCGASATAYPSASLGISFIDVTGPWAR